MVVIVMIVMSMMSTMVVVFNKPRVSAFTWSTITYVHEYRPRYRVNDWPGPGFTISTVVHDHNVHGRTRRPRRGGATVFGKQRVAGSQASFQDENCAKSLSEKTWSGWSRNCPGFACYHKPLSENAWPACPGWSGCFLNPFAISSPRCLGDLIDLTGRIQFLHG